jgi:hypothetical protein
MTMDGKRRTRKSERNEMGNTKEEEERRDDDKDCDPVCAILDRIPADEVWAIMKERGSVKGRMI